MGRLKNKLLGKCTDEQEFSRIVLCHHLWLKTEADEIRKDINYDRQTGSTFADPDHLSEGLTMVKPHLVEKYNLNC